MSAGVTSLRPKSLDTVLGWWAQELGVNVPELMAQADGVSFTESSNVPGVLLFRRGRDLRIAVSRGNLQTIHDAILGKTFQTLFSARFWMQFPKFCGTVVGPATVFYADAPLPRWKSTPPVGFQVRGLSGVDAKAFAEFSQRLTPAEREQSGLELGPRPLWGLFKGKDLIAAAGYDAWPGRIAHIGVAVHPDYRGKRFGQLVVQAAARGALARRRIVQYRTLTENQAGVGLARALHFSTFAETLYLRPPAIA
jgi:GNAT superfamily N-acetyltransferase